MESAEEEAVGLWRQDKPITLGEQHDLNQDKGQGRPFFFSSQKHPQFMV
jgi:hypothetical protein